MATRTAPRRWGAAWPVWAGLAVLAALGGVAALYSRPGEPVAPGPVAAVPQGAPQAPAAAAAPVAPSFDVVRVTPEGSAVLAGRAQPGAEVVVRDGERTLGQVTADPRGEWVMIPDAKLPPGGRALTLAAREAGGPEIRGQDSVVIVVPTPAPSGAAPTAAAPALALLVPPGSAAPKLLQAPAQGPAKLALNTVDYDEKGEIRFSGSAKPATTLRVYVDNQPVGEAKADAAGQWGLTPSQPVSPGLHRFRVDQLAATGRVVGRVELPFQRQAAAQPTFAQDRVVVQPGENLWRIARHAYGAGIRYTVIFTANREQIRDPRLIYPGQVFSTPAP